MTTTPPLPQHVLLENEAGLRRIARGLLRDEHLADDVVQDTWVRALESPPRHLASPAGWLRTVTRNLSRNTLRSRGRAEQRHRDVRVAASEPATDEVAASLERRQLILTAVEVLREPYRATVVARYFDGLTPSAIANRDGLPLATVKTRLRRGLAFLREALDASSGGDRRRWEAAILPLAVPPAASSLATASWAWACLAVGVGVTILVTVLLIRSTASVEDALVVERPSADSPRGGPTLKGAARSRDGAMAAPGGTAVTGAEGEQVGVRDVRLTGRVVDAHGRPVAAASVEVHSPLGEAARTTTDAQGAYVVSLRLRGDGFGASKLATVIARDEHGRVGYRDESLPQARIEEREFSDIALIAGEPLTIECRHAGHAVEGVRVLVTSAVDAVFDQAVLAEAVTDETGLVRFAALPKSDLTVLTWAEGVGRAVHRLANRRRDDTPVRIELPVERPLELTLVVKETGEPLPGLTCELREEVHQPEATWGYGDRGLEPRMGPFVSDTAGRILVRGLCGDEDLELLVRFPPGCAVAPHGFDAYGREHAFDWPRRSDDGVAHVRLAFEAGTRTSWALEAGDGPVPADGTRVSLLTTRILAEKEIHEGLVEDGQLHITAARRGGWLARLDDGRIARVGIERKNVPFVYVDDEGRTVHASRHETRALPVRFVTPRVLDIVVLDANGEPESGAVLQLLMQEAYGWLSRSSFLHTDRSGHVRVEGLYPARYRIRRRSAPVWNAALEVVGEADVLEGDAEVRITREPTVELQLRIVGPDGPFVPPGFALRVGRHHPWQVALDGSLGAVTVQAPRSTLVSASTVVITAPGFLPVVLPFDATEAEAGPPQQVVLEPSATLEMRIERSSLPSEEGEAVWTGGELSLLRWDQASRAWTQVWAQWQREGEGDPRVAGFERRGACLWTVASLPAGTYRVADAESRALSLPAHVYVGDEPGRLSLDLSGTRIVRGRLLPEGEDISQLTLTLSAPELFDPPPWSSQEDVDERPPRVVERLGMYVRRDGTYRVALPMIRGLTLVAEHPERGRAELDVSTVQAGTEGVVDATWPTR